MLKATTVAVTREKGKNDNLVAKLEGLSVVEVPCVAQVRDPEGMAALKKALERTWRWVVVTSPEAGDVLREVASDDLNIATVGPASARGLKSTFSPTKATAKTFATELPGECGDNVLFPASKLAATTLETILRDRGFHVERINAYTTVPAEWDSQLENDAKSADIVAFGSPSAVDVWRSRIGATPIAVCIGETTAKACKDAGFPNILFPAKPGLGGWADQILQAAAGTN